MGALADDRQDIPYKASPGFTCTFRDVLEHMHPRFKYCVHIVYSVHLVSVGGGALVGQLGGEKPRATCDGKRVEGVWRWKCGSFLGALVGREHSGC